MTVSSHLHHWTIQHFQVVGTHCVELQFADGLKRTIDFSPVVGGWLSALRDAHYFSQVQLTETGNLQWPNGEDFNPEALHDWPDFEALYIQDAQRTTAPSAQH
jgi:hypothetical protein